MSDLRRNGIRTLNRTRPHRKWLLARPVAISRAVSGAGLARHRGPLQADGDRSCVGNHPSILTMVVGTVVFGKLSGRCEWDRLSVLSFAVHVVNSDEQFWRFGVFPAGGFSFFRRVARTSGPDPVPAVRAKRMEDAQALFCELQGLNWTTIAASPCGWKNFLPGPPPSESRLSVAYLSV